MEKSNFDVSNQTEKQNTKLNALGLKSNSKINQIK